MVLRYLKYGILLKNGEILILRQEVPFFRQGSSLFTKKVYICQKII